MHSSAKPWRAAVATRTGMTRSSVSLPIKPSLNGTNGLSESPCCRAAEMVRPSRESCRSSSAWVARKRSCFPKFDPVLVSSLQRAEKSSGGLGSQDSSRYSSADTVDLSLLVNVAGDRLSPARCVPYDLSQILEQNWTVSWHTSSRCALISFTVLNLGFECHDCRPN